MTFDFDDFAEDNHRLDLLHQLKLVNPAFKCTVFAIPTRGSATFWESVPTWIELAMHGWEHGDPPVDGGECKDWSIDQMCGAMQRKPPGFVDGFKAPGWQISQSCLLALAGNGWWLADQPYNDTRRPRGLRVHRLGDGDHSHHHVQDVCGNGLSESFAELMAKVRAAKSFEFVSEVVQPWR